nr:hypothetical protein Iba_chr03aCG5190 [Ipomoea batatas]GMD40106.1 hypothetical protein Iba_chr10aCG6180 [Ipomoea batatas]
MRILIVAALQSYFSISSRAAFPIVSRNSGLHRRGSSLFKQSSRSPGLYKYPILPCWSSGIISGIPPARAATTGSPDDMASKTTSPSVSDSEGMTKTSPLANNQSFCNDATHLYGPSPIKAIRASGSLSITLFLGIKNVNVAVELQPEMKT